MLSFYIAAIPSRRFVFLVFFFASDDYFDIYCDHRPRECGGLDVLAELMALQKRFAVRALEAQTKLLLMCACSQELVRKACVTD